jgi:hypothetical protein
MTFKKGRIPWNKGKHWSKEMKEKLSLSHVGCGTIPWNKGKHWSKEMKEKLSLSHVGCISYNKGTHWTDEMKEKNKLKRVGMVLGMSGKHHSEETKEKIRFKKFGQSHPQKIETRKKISQSRIGKNYGIIPWNKGKIGIMPTPWNKGKKMSKEFCEKDSESRKGSIPWNKGKTGLQVSWNKGKKFLRGKDHWNWKGGITAKSQEFRESLEYKEWRRKVYERDNFTCQICLNKSKKIVAHHIKSYWDHVNLRIDIDNGITLCRCCHINLHREIKIKMLIEESIK